MSYAGTVEPDGRAPAGVPPLASSSYLELGTCLYGFSCIQRKTHGWDEMCSLLCLHPSTSLPPPLTTIFLVPLFTPHTHTRPGKLTEISASPLRSAPTTRCQCLPAAQNPCRCPPPGNPAVKRRPLGVALGGAGQKFVPASAPLLQVHFIQPDVGLSHQSLLHKLTPIGHQEELKDRRE